MPCVFVKSFADLMGGHDKAQVVNLLDGSVVRDLVVKGSEVEINPGEGYPIVMVPLSLEIKYEPLFMDRGNLVFVHADYPPFAKICTEHDSIRYPDGTECNIAPHPDAEKVGDTAEWMRRQQRGELA